MNVTIPANSEATIYITAKSADQIMESGKVLSAIKEITVTGKEEGYVVVKVGSGDYKFVINNN